MSIKSTFNLNNVTLTIEFCLDDWSAHSSTVELLKCVEMVNEFTHDDYAGSFWRLCESLAKCFDLKAPMGHSARVIVMLILSTAEAKRSGISQRNAPLFNFLMAANYVKYSNDCLEQVQQAVAEQIRTADYVLMFSGLIRFTNDLVSKLNEAEEEAMIASMLATIERSKLLMEAIAVHLREDPRDIH